MCKKPVQRLTSKPYHPHVFVATVLLTNMMTGLSEILEVQEKYAHLQEEQLDNLKDDLVTCIHGEEGQGGDDVATHGNHFNFAFLMMITLNSLGQMIQKVSQ